MADIPGMVRLKKCPLNGGCRAKLLWQDADNNLWTFNNKAQDFKEHRCSTKGSRMPDTMYMAAWYNTRTETTRYLTARLESSVKHAPSSVTQPTKEWKLTGIYETKCEWSKISDS